MLKTVTILLLAIFSIFSYAQKPRLENTYYSNWPTISNVQINGDGKFIMYNLLNNSASQASTFIKATRDKWERRFEEVSQIAFSHDNRAVYLVDHDSLFQIRLGAKTTRLLAKASEFKLVHNAAREYLIYKLGTSNSIIVMNLQNERRIEFPNVMNYVTSPPGNSLMLATKSQDSLEIVTLNLHTFECHSIYRGTNVSDVIFDQSGERIAFITQDIDESTIWFCDGRSNAIRVLAGRDLTKQKSLSPNSVWKFSDDGNYLYISTQQNEVLYQNTPIGFEIWSYQDKVILPEFKQQKFQANAVKSSLIKIDVATKSFSELLLHDEEIINIDHLVSGQIIIKQKAQQGENQNLYYVLNAETGARRLVKSSPTLLRDFEFSPEGRFVIYRDSTSFQLNFYDLLTAITYDFKKVGNQLQLYDQRTHKPTPNYRGIIGWIKGTTHVIIQGMFCIWEIDVTNVQAPRNLTRIGHNDPNTFFSINRVPNNQLIDPSKDLYIHGINLDTKMTTVFKLNIKKEELVKLHAGDFFWSMPYEEVENDLFQKAGNAEAFVMMFPTVERTPNLLFSKDFKQFKSITTIFPEQNYNWISSELHTYRGADSSVYQGILYKPEDFDPSKRYPVILNFYQDVSNTLHEYLQPQPVSAGINIPFLVSNGYLVYRPDIHISKGRFGEELLASISAAADHLSSLSWVDSTKLAISGHSFGGYEVNNLITVTDRFAAAFSGAGFSSITNNIFDLGYRNEEVRAFAKNNSMMDVEFEDNPSAYIKYSPIFYTKKIKTPILLVHSEDDKNVPFYHSMQLFLSLRHLKRPAWLLSYKNGGHGVPQPERIDYMNKLKGFFDYYLMGQPMPEWMSKYIRN